MNFSCSIITIITYMWVQMVLLNYNFNKQYSHFRNYYYESYSLFEEGIEIISDSLNDKVEIIIEDNKIENGLKLYKDYLKDLEGDGCENYHNVTETQYLHRLSIIINELIDEVNALKENNKWL